MHNFRLINIALGESENCVPCYVNEHVCNSTLTGSLALLLSCGETQHYLCVPVTDLNYAVILRIAKGQTGEILGRRKWGLSHLLSRLVLPSVKCIWNYDCPTEQQIQRGRCQSMSCFAVAELVCGYLFLEFFFTLIRYLDVDAALKIKDLIYLPSLRMKVPDHIYVLGHSYTCYTYRCYAYHFYAYRLYFINVTCIWVT
jgi:hypothetical protein